MEVTTFNDGIVAMDTITTFSGDVPLCVDFLVEVNHSGLSESWCQHFASEAEAREEYTRLVNEWPDSQK